MKIKFIELQEPKLTVDIEVENTHSYLLSNGVVSHNTVGKMMDTTEGIHRPLSKYIINNIIVSKASPLCKTAIDAGYRHFEHPFDNTSEIISLPICFENVEFDTVEINGKILEVNLESAVSQLNRYKMWMDNYADHNVSITVSYSPDEVEDIVEWLHSNWDHFVGVSFLLRADPTKTAEDLGYIYLPQQPITKEDYYEYIATIKEVDLDNIAINSLEELENDCATGVCPIR
jgi:ribonucleoside-triphosphate reductase